MQQHCSKHFARRHPSVLGMGSIGQKSTFSEHGHVAYQITGNHEMQQHGRNMVEIVQVRLFFIELRPEFFYKLIYKPSYCNFPESRRKKLFAKIIFLYLPNLNIICFLEKKCF